jgi:hypothetical protein
MRFRCRSAFCRVLHAKTLVLSMRTQPQRDHPWKAKLPVLGDVRIDLGLSDFMGVLESVMPSRMQ